MQPEYFDKQLLKHVQILGIIGHNSMENLYTARYFASQYDMEHKVLLSNNKKLDGFKSIFSKEDLMFIENNTTLIVHDYQTIFPRDDRKSNIKLRELLDMVIDKNIMLILTSNSNTEVDRKTEMRVDAWIIRQLRIDLLRNGSIVKIALDEMKNHPDITSFGIRVLQDEFFFYDLYPTELGVNTKYKLPITIDVPVEQHSMSER